MDLGLWNGNGLERNFLEFFKSRLHAVRLCLCVFNSWWVEVWFRADRDRNWLRCSCIARLATIVGYQNVERAKNFGSWIVERTMSSFSLAAGPLGIPSSFCVNLIVLAAIMTSRKEREEQLIMHFC